MSKCARLASALALLLLAGCKGRTVAISDPKPDTPPDAMPTPHQACVPAFEVTPSAGVRFVDYAGDASAWRAPTQMKVEIEPPRTSADGVELTARLSNSGRDPIEALALAGGVPGQSSNPWNVIPNLALVPEPPSATPAPVRPEIYPYVRAVVLPAGASVRYTRRLCWSAYVPAPDRTATLAWSFELWGAERRTGKVSIPRP